MNIRLKLTLFMSLILIFTVAVLTFFSVLGVKSHGNEQVSTYRAEEIRQVRDHLKDLVDIAYETVDDHYQRISDLSYLSDFYERKLNDTVNSGERIIQGYQRLVKSGDLSLTEAKNKAKSEISQLRYDNGTGYLWINDTTMPFPTMVMHPTLPELDGQVLNDPKYNNAQGIDKNLFTAAVEVTSGDSKDGFIDYLWPKPVADGLTEKAPKLSYVRRFDDWGWILGTGIYLDDAESDLKERIKESIKSMKYADGTGYFWINDDTLPYPTMIMHPVSPELDGQVLDDPKFNNAQGVDNNLFTAFVEVTKEEDHAGFVDYLWPKPTATGLTERKPKESYVRLHKPTGWIIGTGVYIDNIDEIVEIKKAEVEEQVSDLILKNILSGVFFVVVGLILAFMFANTLTKPILGLTELARNISLGKNLEDEIPETKRKDEIGQLARAVARLRSSVTMMMSRMAKDD